MATSQSQHVLSERSPNTTSPTKNGAVAGFDSGEKKSTWAMMDEKQDHAFQGLRQSQNQSQTYISPSDTIQSPTTKKLSDLKARKINGSAGAMKGRSLFKGIVGRREMKELSSSESGSSPVSEK